METMTVHQAAALEMDAADRMRKALRVSGLSVSEIAEHLEVSRNAVSAWINGHHMPRKRDLRDFCEFTGVTPEWVETGKIFTTDDEWDSIVGWSENLDTVRPEGLEPPTF